MTGRVYYNDFDPDACETLENLIHERLIPAGVVDRRSITEVQPGDLDGFVHCHFFAGIGGWALAAELAGWPLDRPLWTGSCPCQPFSAAGKKLGADDPRHLWPDFFRLIGAGRPPVVVGEQVAGKAGYGWFDGVRTDLGGEDYASRCIDIPAAAVDSPQIRQRLWWAGIDMAGADRGGLRADGGDHREGAGEAVRAGGPVDHAAVPGGRDAPGAPGRTQHVDRTGGFDGGGHAGGHAGPEAGAQREVGHGGVGHRVVAADEGYGCHAAGGASEVAGSDQGGCGRGAPSRLHDQGQLGHDADRRHVHGRGPGRSDGDAGAASGCEAPTGGAGGVASGAGEQRWQLLEERGPQGRTAAAGDDAGERGRGVLGHGEVDGSRAGLRETGQIGHGAELADADGAAGTRLGAALGRAEGGGLAFGEQPGGFGGDAFDGGYVARANVRNGSWWADHGWIVCHDGKARRLSEPRAPLLVTGVSGRLAVLRSGRVIAPEDAEVIPEDVRWVRRTAAWKGFGNAINPVLAAEVLGALLDGW